MKNTLLILLTALLAFSTYGQVAERMDSIMLIYQAKGFNGNVLYSKGDSILFKGNYGYRQIDKQTPLNDSTIFELASCSKQFTALAIVQLVEKSLISYQTKVDEIIEGFPYQNITIEHLLRHQSGLPDYMVLMYKRKVWKRRNIATNQDVINAFKKFKPKKKFEPGTQYEYSNTGYLLLASIVEEVSKKSYEEYMAEYVFEPAQMTHSKIYRRRYRPEDVQNLSEGYVYNKLKKTFQKVDLSKKHSYVYWLDGIVGDGMVHSTILDLEKWKQAIRYNTLISEESKAKMFSVDSVSVDYGYGFVIKEKPVSGKLIYHDGAWAGYHTIIIYSPKLNGCVVVLCNSDYGNLLEIVRSLTALRK